MGFWLTFILWIASFVLGELLRPKPKVQNAKPAGLGDFNVPTASEARPLPVAWGTCWIEGPNTLWYGDLEAKPITKTIKTGIKSKKKQTIGHAYLLGMDLGLCHGRIDALLEIRADEDKVAWTGNLQDGQLTINKPDLFGGQDGEGGLGGFQFGSGMSFYNAGLVDLYSGSTSQGRNSYLASVLSPDVPAYRGICHLVFRHFYFGNSTYLKALKFKVKRLPANLGNGKQDIGGQANPAEMLYELFTNEAWGMGGAASQLDLASFQAAASKLHAEGFGMSMVWDNRVSVEEIAGEILRHIDGVIYADLATGKLVLALARDDYNVADLPQFDETNVLDFTDFGRTALDETCNEVRVLYREELTEKTAIAQDLANRDTQGAVVSTEISYYGCPTSALANKLSYRDLRALSFPLAKGSLKMNRAGYTLRPASVIRLTWAKYGIAQIVMRVIRVRPGELASGGIEVDVVQDVFSISSSIYADPAGTGWQPPTTDPVDPQTVQTLEAPYMLRLLNGGEAGEAYPMILVPRPSGDSLSFELYSALGSAPWEYEGTQAPFTPSGTLRSSVGPMETSVTIESPVDLAYLQPPPAGDQDQGSTLILLDGELCAFGTVTANGDGSYALGGLWRGLLDTTPHPHAAGARVWCLAQGAGITVTPYASGDTIHLRALPTTLRGTLALESATDRDAILAGRAEKPYAPGAYLLNGASFPAFITGPCSASWTHRDRTLQTAYLVQHGADNIGPEAGVTYTVRIYGEGGGLKRTVTGLTGTSYAYDLATEISDAGLGGRPNEEMRWAVSAVVGGAESHQAEDHTFECHGYGMFYGDSYGE